MSPEVQVKKPTINSNLYTVFLAFAFFVVLATAAFVAFKCFTMYGTIFNIP
jgi:hypothetical protein